MKKTIRKTNDFGFIEIRTPNIPEALRIIGPYANSENPVKNLSNIIEGLGELVNQVAFTLDGEIIDTYDKALNCLPLISIITELATDLLNELSGESKKKI